MSIPLPPPLAAESAAGAAACNKIVEINDIFDFY
jgi:hypothetical protein